MLFRSKMPVMAYSPLGGGSGVGSLENAVGNSSALGFEVGHEMLQKLVLVLRLHIPRPEVDAGHVRGRGGEPLLSQVAVGRLLTVRCDGCPPGALARVSYVAPEPEYTPPVIYSLESRQKLVWLVEARPAGEAAQRLKPGQIVDIALAGAGK